MIRIALLLCIVVCACASSITQLTQNEEWTLFKKDYNKTFDAKEDVRRMKIFMDNVKFIEEHNKKYEAKQVSFGVGINEYADMTTEEFGKVMNGFHKSYKKIAGPSSISLPNEEVIPATVDWRTKGFVTPVKNQQQCLSSWAFSATGSLEGQHKKKTGKLVSLSEQNLIDCTQTPRYGNHGCEGGGVLNAFNYVYGGIDTEESYPYQAKDSGYCGFAKASVGVTCAGYGFLSRIDHKEDGLKYLTATVGPMSVEIDAAHSSFQFYSHGVYDEPQCSSVRLDRSVLVVGYGTENSKDYWLVKNSFGTDWGMSGYIKMSRNKKNQCGIATAVIYPIV